jgi:hypothetical protein
MEKLFQTKKSYHRCNRNNESRKFNLCPFPISVKNLIKSFVNINSMPFTIKKISPLGYIVVSLNGTVLSKKPLSLSVARAQMTAVNIAEHKKKSKKTI